MHKYKNRNRNRNRNRNSLNLTGIFAIFLMMFYGSSIHATLISVAGPNSSMGAAAAIAPAPLHALDDIATNTAMQGFNEALGLTTSVNHNTDGGGVIAAGTMVDSHMIFLNSSGPANLSHFGTIWTFSAPIIGIMSDGNGNLEAASTFELGAPGTNYTAIFGGSGPAAPFPARGLEGNNGTGLGGDGYQLLAPNVLRIGMNVSEPGDWIRVVTRSTAIVPEPSIPLLLGIGIGALFVRRRNQK